MLFQKKGAAYGVTTVHSYALVISVMLKNRPKRINKSWHGLFRRFGGVKLPLVWSLSVMGAKVVAKGFSKHSNQVCATCQLWRVPAAPVSGPVSILPVKSVGENT